MAIRSSSLPSIIRVTLLLGAQLTALVALLRAGEVPGLAFPTGNLGQWLVTTPPEQAVMVALRLVGLVGAGWMMTSSLLYLVARAAGFPRALRAVNWMTLPAMRRAVDRALALSVATSTVIGGGMPAYASETVGPPPPALAPPALLHTPADSVEEADDAEGDPGEMTQETPAPRPSPIPEPRDLARGDDGDRSDDEDRSTESEDPAQEVEDEPSEPPEEDGDHGEESPEEEPEDGPSDDEPAVDEPSVHTVQAGESLWSIAEAHAGADGNDAIATYWVALLEANADLARDDPDLIHPGDRITLPQP